MYRGVFRPGVQPLTGDVCLKSGMLQRYSLELGWQGPLETDRGEYDENVEYEIDDVVLMTGERNGLWIYQAAGFWACIAEASHD